MAQFQPFDLNVQFTIIINADLISVKKIIFSYTLVIPLIYTSLHFNTYSVNFCNFFIIFIIFFSFILVFCIIFVIKDKVFYIIYIYIWRFL